MRQQSFQHRGKKSGSIGGGIFVVLTVGVGAFLVYHLILWFRSDNAQIAAEEAAEQTNSSEKSEVTAFTETLKNTAVLKASDGSSVGTVVRSGTSEDPSYSLLANLAVPPSGSSYEVWLVKDGLADVKSAGSLTPRADGSWVETFTTKNALDYPTIVIMLEPNDENTEPSGNRIAEGKFE